MLGRLNISSNPARIIKAPFRVKIWLWSAKYVGRHTESDQAYVSFTKEDCAPHTATPLPDPSGGALLIPIILEVGEELWAVSESVTLLGMTTERI